MRVLGIDPGYAIVGWGVVDYVGNRFAPVDFGAVTTGAGLPFEQRLSEVYDGVCEVIHRTRPEVLAIEKLFYQHNQTTVIGVAEARGVLLRAAAQAGEFGHSVERELSYLTVHSVLHLLGYDHMDEGPMKRQMRVHEEFILDKLGITREMEEETP